MCVFKYICADLTVMIGVTVVLHMKTYIYVYTVAPIDACI